MKARKTRKSFIKERRNLAKLREVTWWAVNEKDGLLRRDYLSKRRQFVKRKCNKEIRKNYDIGNGSSYRKASEFWYDVI